MTKNNVLVWLVSVASTILCAPGSWAGQVETAATIQVKTNLVLVPVFVYRKDRMARTPAEESRCAYADGDTFYRLPLSKPYLPMACDEAVMRGLTAKDFRVFDDGVEQRIEGVTVEGWPVAVRDNLAWHLESSITPLGIWSSPDMGRSFPDPGLDQDFYLIAYVPPPKPTEGSCHNVEVKVARRNAPIFARDQYCAGQSASDPLFGTESGKQLERDLASAESTNMGLFLQSGSFYAGADAARVHITLGFEWKRLYREWSIRDWTRWARFGVMGVAYRKDRSIAARFSDLLYPSYWPTFGQDRKSLGEVLGGAAGPEITENVTSSFDLAWLPTRYDTQIDLPAGEYDLRVAISDGQNLGRAGAGLVVDNYDGKDLALSSVMLCNRFRDAHVAAVEAAAADFAPQYVPLVSKGIQVTPTGDTRFRAGEPLIPYFQIYEPLLVESPATAVQAHIRILDAKTGQLRDDFWVDAAPYEQAGKWATSVARQIATDKMAKGAYRLEVQASDSAGRTTAVRTATFTIE